MSGMKVKAMKGYGSSALGRLGDMRHDDSMSRGMFMEHDDQGNPMEAPEEKQVDTDFFNGRAPASHTTPQRNPHQRETLRSSKGISGIRRTCRA